jgi:anti-sigma B factor antagonist
MSFTIERRDDATVVAIPESLVAENARELKRLVLDDLENGGRKFLLDFARAGYVDSSGLGMLVSLLKQVRRVQGDLRVVNLNEELRRIFELTRLDMLFPREDLNGEGGAGRTSPLVPRPSGPLRGSAESEPRDRSM